MREPPQLCEYVPESRSCTLTRNGLENGVDSLPPTMRAVGRALRPIGSDGTLLRLGGVAAAARVISSPWWLRNSFIGALFGAMSTRSQPSNCLFLPELPDDLPDDTLERHFRGYEGYITSRTRKDRNQKTVGFVEFELIEQAVRCREEMQDQSPFGGLTWHIHYSNNPGRGAAAAPTKRPRDEPMREPVERRDAQRVPHPQMHEQRPMYDQRSPMMQGQGGPSPGAAATAVATAAAARRAAWTTRRRCRRRPPRGGPPAGPGWPGDGAADGPATDAAGPGVRRRTGARLQRPRRARADDGCGTAAARPRRGRRVRMQPPPRPQDYLGCRCLPTRRRRCTSRACPTTRPSARWRRSSAGTKGWATNRSA